MHDLDRLHRFIFEDYPIRGHMVHVDAAWRALIEHRDYPAAVRDALGEAVAASLLLAATIKFEGVLSLQLQGDGAVHLMLVQCTEGLGVRGLARHRNGGHRNGGHRDEGHRDEGHRDEGHRDEGHRDEGHRDDGFEAGGKIGDLFGVGTLTVTLETGGAQRYQGIVPIVGERLAESLQAYFENSEQLPTRLWLHSDEQGVSGMLLQKLPSDQSTPVEQSALDDAWRRVQLIGDTLTRQELRTLRDAEILHRLFNEDDVRMFEPAPVYFRCRCSRDRVVGMLQGLGETEVRSIIAERGRVEVHCDFCNRAYAFDAVDAAQLFNTNVADSGKSMH